MEWIKTGNYPSVPVTAVVLDFDGTVSTLREGWETIMEPLMLEMISPEMPPSAGLGQKGAGLYLRIHRNSNYFPNGMAGGTGKRGWRIKGASRRLVV